MEEGKGWSSDENSGQLWNGGHNYVTTVGLFNKYIFFYEHNIDYIVTWWSGNKIIISVIYDYMIARKSEASISRCFLLLLFQE